MTTSTYLDPAALWQRLQRFPPPTGYCVAYSGGRDSHVLLHLMTALRDRLQVALRAVHINHRLQPAADDWATHCRDACRQLAVPLDVLTVTCAVSDTSPEEAARAARYRAFERVVAPGEALLLAHHQEDQAETVLLRLLRGAGLHGVAAMPAARPLGRGRLLRPLLDVPAAAVAQYALAQALVWVEDPSNRDDRFDRNFLRRRVLPVLAQRWPGYAAPLTRAAEQAREAAASMDALADLDLARCAPTTDAIDVDALQTLPEARQRNLVRRWLRRQGLQPPGRARLQSGLRALTQAASDRAPRLEWNGLQLRRYRNRLLLQAVDMESVPEPQAWDLDRPLDLPDGRLLVEPVVGAGLRRELRGRRVEVRFRAGGERCRPAGRGHSQRLKKLLQERGMPPWERHRLPLIYVDGDLAAVADLWVCEGFQARSGEPGLRPIWRRVVHQGPFC